MRRVPLSALVASGVVSIGWLAGPSAFAQATEQAPTLTLEIVGGQVTLEAHNVTARRILEEWARVGGTTIVNADQLPDDRISLELRGVPEAKAFALLLRSAAGYVAVRRRQASTAGSQFDRIFVLGGPSAEKLFEVSSAEIEGWVQDASGAPPVPTASSPFPDAQSVFPDDGAVATANQSPVAIHATQGGPASPGSAAFGQSSSGGVPETTSVPGVPVPSPSVQRPETPGPELNSGLPDGQPTAPPR